MTRRFLISNLFGEGVAEVAKILAVDDSAAMRQMVSMALSSIGHQVREVEDGDEALTLAREESFDLVITDVNMPKMDGIRLVRELRSLPAYRLVPLLVLTTESSAEKKSEGRCAGATGWLVKPFDPDRLLAVVARVLG